MNIGTEAAEVTELTGVGMPATEARLNLALFILIFFVPLQNIYMGKIPSFGAGLNFLNIMMALAFYYSLRIDGTGFSNSYGKQIAIYLLGYIISAFQSALYMESYNPDVTDLLKDIFYSYLFFFVAYKSIDSMRAMKLLFWATVLPLPYMFRVFYSNLSWMGFSTYKDKLRLNNGTFMLLGSNEVAAFYASYTFIILAVALQEERRWPRRFLFLCVGLNCYSLVYSFSRGAYLSAMIGIVVFAWISGRMKKLVGILAVILLLTVVGAQVLPKAVTERFESTYAGEEERDESAQSRLVLWDIAMQKFGENPLLGIGFNNFKKINEYGKDTHNYYVKLLVEGGIVSLALYLSLVIAACRLGIRLLRTADDPFLQALASGFLPCLAAIFVGNFFGDRFSYYPLISYFFVYMAMIARGVEWSGADDGKSYKYPAFNQQ